MLPSNWLEVYATAPFGISRPYVAVPPRRAFTESGATSLGWYAGGTVGAGWMVVARWPFTWTFTGELGYAFHTNGQRTTLIVGGATTEEHRQVVDHELAITVATGVDF